MTSQTVNPPAARIDIANTAVTLLIAGAFATLAFDIFGKAISPMLGFATLAPVPLANAVIAKIFGQGFTPAAHALHYATGMLGYPLGWLILDQIRRHVAPNVPWLAAAVAYGIALWAFALYVMAHLVAGNPPFLGFTGITWVALIGHVVFTVIAAGVFRLRERNAA